MFRQTFEPSPEQKSRILPLHQPARFILLYCVSVLQECCVSKLAILARERPLELAKHEFRMNYFPITEPNPIMNIK